jgi:alpha-beta hydrolase superfamily lysophospholipase
MEKIETIPREDNTLIPARLWMPEIPSQNIRGVVHICHGVAEHSARYRKIAITLNQAQFIVIAHDHRGHGLSAATSEELGHFAHQQGWKKTVRDIFYVNQFIRKTFPEKPIILLGHSMGSFLSLSYLELHPKSVSAFVASGSAYKPPFVCKSLGLVAKAERLRLGVQGKSSLVDKIAFLGYNKEFKPQRTSSDWLSRDPAAVQQYINDPKCNFVCTAKLWEDFAYGVSETFRPATFAKLPKKIPYYLFSGDKDPVSQNGKQLKQLSEKLKAIGVKDVTLKLYPKGRHEMLNEINVDEVSADLVLWLAAHFSTEYLDASSHQIIHATA